MQDYITSEEMRREEAKAVAGGTSIEALMENAGRGLAAKVGESFHGVKGKRVAVIAGKGNNGGDGMVAARYLSEAGADVSLILLCEPDGIKTREARLNWDRLASTGVRKLVSPDPDSLSKRRGAIDAAEILIVGIFGTGIKGNIREPEATAIRLANASAAAKVAVDIPSGLDPDTGEVKDPTFKADLTVTMHRPKAGMRGRESVTGRIEAIEIGI